MTPNSLAVLRSCILDENYVTVLHVPLSNVENTLLLPPQRGGIIVSPTCTYKQCVTCWCSTRINLDLKKLGAHGGPG